MYVISLLQCAFNLLFFFFYCKYIFFVILIGQDNFLLQAFIHQSTYFSAQSQNLMAYESFGCMHKAILV